LFLFILFLIEHILRRNFVFNELPEVSDILRR